MATIIEVGGVAPTIGQDVYHERRRLHMTTSRVRLPDDERAA
jgi:hypothetical protein